MLMLHVQAGEHAGTAEHTPGALAALDEAAEPLTAQLCSQRMGACAGVVELRRCRGQLHQGRAGAPHAAGPEGPGGSPGPAGSPAGALPSSVVII